MVLKLYLKNERTKNTQAGQNPFLKIFVNIYKNISLIAFFIRNYLRSLTHQITATMTLTNEIRQNPYLKVSNCTDKSDLEYAIDECRKIEIKYGQSKTLDRIWIALINKKKSLAE